MVGVSSSKAEARSGARQRQSARRLWPSMTSNFSPSIFKEGLVRITIQPALAWLGRRDHGMAARACVLAGVLIRRIVATQRPAALLTCPQMHPARADLHALSTLAAPGMFDIRDCGKMSAGFVRHNRFLNFVAPDARRRQRSMMKLLSSSTTQPFTHHDKFDDWQPTEMKLRASDIEAR